MRQAFAGSLVACLLLLPTVTMAQDEDLRMGDDPAYFERVEVPEVGIAMAFPPEWDVEIEMDYDENEPGDPDTGYWTVLYADGGGATWCDMTMNASRMGDLAGLAALTAENFAASLGEAASAQANPVRLTVGDGYRVDVQDPDEGRFTTIYIFDSETARYSMVCMTDERDEGDWMDIAETIEWLPEDGIIEPPGTEPVDEPQPEPVDTPRSDDGRIEVPAAGISLAIPEGWTYETMAETSDYHLPSEFGEGSTVPRTRVISMDPGRYALGSCGITTFETMPMSLEQHAHELGSRLSGSDPSTLPVTTLIELPIGDAARVDFEFVANDYPSAGWAFDVDGLRVVVDCWADRDEKSVWGAMVESIEPLGAEPVEEPPPEPFGDGQRIEIPGTDIAITFPVDWVVETTFEEDFFELPQEYGDDATVINWEVLLALSPEASLCFVEVYEDMPLGLVEHGDLLARRLDQSDTGTVESEPAALPVGQSVRVTLSDPDEELFMEAYLFDAGGARYEFSCLDAVHSDAWRGLAETIESLAPDDQGTDPERQVPSDVPPYELERLEVPEAGLSLLLPPDWDVEIPMKELGYGLPPEYEDIGVIETVKVLEADSGMGEMCSLNRHADNPMPLQEHADVGRAGLSRARGGRPCDTRRAQGLGGRWRGRREDRLHSHRRTRAHERLPVRLGRRALRAAVPQRRRREPCLAADRRLGAAARRRARRRARA